MYENGCLFGVYLLYFYRRVYGRAGFKDPVPFVCGGLWCLGLIPVGLFPPHEEKSGKTGTRAAISEFHAQPKP